MQKELITILRNLQTSQQSQVFSYLLSDQDDNLLSNKSQDQSLSFGYIKQIKNKELLSEISRLKTKYQQQLKVKDQNLQQAKVREIQLKRKLQEAKEIEINENQIINYQLLQKDQQISQLNLFIDQLQKNNQQLKLGIKKFQDYQNNLLLYIKILQQNNNNMVQEQGKDKQVQTESYKYQKQQTKKLKGYVNQVIQQFTNIIQQQTFYNQTRQKQIKYDYQIKIKQIKLSNDREKFQLQKKYEQQIRQRDQTIEKITKQKLDITKLSQSEIKKLKQQLATKNQKIQLMKTKMNQSQRKIKESQMQIIQSRYKNQIKNLQRKIQEKDQANKRLIAKLARHQKEIRMKRIQQEIQQENMKKQKEGFQERQQK